MDSATFSNELRALQDEGQVYRLDEFYSIINDHSLPERRRKGNARAQLLLKRASRIGRFLSAFPFVTGVAISGSLSKNYADERADIDFFIITRSNRLWIARTLMHIFKKFTFITGKQNLYCMNYYIDHLSLEIAEQNIYTAIEVATLIPVKGESLPLFFSANRWVRNWFSSYGVQNFADEKSRPRTFKRICEYLLNSNKLDDLFMRITSKRWKKKMNRHAKNDEGRRMNLELDKHFARSNPDHFQQTLLGAYVELLQSYENRNNTVIISSAR